MVLRSGEWELGSACGYDSLAHNNILNYRHRFNSNDLHDHIHDFNVHFGYDYLFHYH